MAAIKRFNICTKKSYKKNEEEKVFWPNVGSLIYFEAQGDRKGGYKLELSMFPNVEFFVFEQVDKNAQPRAEKEIQSDDVPY